MEQNPTANKQHRSIMEEIDRDKGQAAREHGSFGSYRCNALESGDCRTTLLTGKMHLRHYLSSLCASWRWEHGAIIEKDGHHCYALMNNPKKSYRPPSLVILTNRSQAGNNEEVTMIFSCAEINIVALKLTIQQHPQHLRLFYMLTARDFFFFFFTAAPQLTTGRTVHTANWTIQFFIIHP